MTATNNDHDSHKHVFWRFRKRTPLVFHVFIAVAVLVYLVAVMV